MLQTPVKLSLTARNAGETLEDVLADAAALEGGNAIRPLPCMKCMKRLVFDGKSKSNSIIEATKFNATSPGHQARAQGMIRKDEAACSHGPLDLEKCFYCAKIKKGCEAVGCFPSNHWRGANTWM